VAKAQPFQIACCHCKGVDAELKINVSIEKGDETSLRNKIFLI
jgi:hypothetical protein